MILNRVKLMEGSLPSSGKCPKGMVYSHNIFKHDKKHGSVNSRCITFTSLDEFDEGDIVNINYNEEFDSAIITKCDSNTNPDKYLFFKSAGWKIPTSIETEETYEILDNSLFSKEIITACSSNRFGIKGLLFIVDKDTSVTIKQTSSYSITDTYEVSENDEFIPSRILDGIVPLATV